MLSSVLTKHNPCIKWIREPVLLFAFAKTKTNHTSLILGVTQPDDIRHTMC